MFRRWTRTGYLVEFVLLLFPSGSERIAFTLDPGQDPAESNSVAAFAGEVPAAADNAFDRVTKLGVTEPGGPSIPTPATPWPKAVWAPGPGDRGADPQPAQSLLNLAKETGPGWRSRTLHDTPRSCHRARGRSPSHLSMLRSLGGRRSNDSDCRGSSCGYPDRPRQGRLRSRRVLGTRSRTPCGRACGSVVPPVRY